VTATQRPTFRLRELVPVSNAIVGIDYADNKQMVSSPTMIRSPGAADLPLPGWDLGSGLDWRACTRVRLASLG